MRGRIRGHNWDKGATFHTIIYFLVGIIYVVFGNKVFVKVKKKGNCSLQLKGYIHISCSA
jgi:hypothetical protein